MDRNIYNITNNRLQAAIDYVKQKRNEIALFLVVNLKTSSNYLNQYDFSSEFFSEDELSDYINALESLGIYRDVSYGEDEFIRKISTGYFQKFPQKYKIAFNTTGSKQIRSRSALIPALCELVNLKYASSDILSCSILENKVHANQLLQSFGYKIPHCWIFHHIYGWMGQKPPKNIKLIVKPATECASIGITKDSIGYYSNKLECLIDEISKKLRTPVVVQEFIKGWEVEVPIVNIDGPVALPPMGIELDGEKCLNDNALCYDTVFSDSYNYYRFDHVSRDLSTKLMEEAEKSYRSLDLSGIVRVDFRIQTDNKYYITDYNNSPHLTHFHSVAKSFTSLGFEYPDIFCLLLYPAINSDFSQLSPDL